MNETNKYDIYITDTRTQEQKVYNFSAPVTWPAEEQDRLTTFYFTEGNMGCDCNLWIVYNSYNPPYAMACNTDKHVMRLDKILNTNTEESIFSQPGNTADESKP